MFSSKANSDSRESNFPSSPKWLGRCSRSEATPTSRRDELGVSGPSQAQCGVAGWPRKREVSMKGMLLLDCSNVCEAEVFIHLLCEVVAKMSNLIMNIL
jgi:hypothetical protein